MTPVVRREDTIACLCEWDDYMAELVRCFGEAVDEEDRALGLAKDGEALGVEDANLRLGLLDPELTVVRFREGFRCHCMEARVPLAVQKL